MTTREEMAWEVESAARRAMRVAHGSRGISAKSRWINAATRIDSAASQLKRDGELRKRLKVLSTGWRNSPESLTEKDCADELDLVVEDLG